MFWVSAHRLATGLKLFIQQFYPLLLSNLAFKYTSGKKIVEIPKTLL
jgi:hypothetical protein